MPEQTLPHAAPGHPDGLSELVAAKQDTVVSVCLPARNEADTVGKIVEIVRRELMEHVALVDELIVIDDHSTDGTEDVAAAAGARVIQAAAILPSYGEGHGKGEAMWKSLFAARGDLIVWCDADVSNFTAGFVVELLRPLLTDERVAFVKGYYERPEDGWTGGGRVTELVARPALSLLFPDLGDIVQPLAGEYAGRRSVLEHLPFVEGYGVEIGLLIDVANRVGVDAIAQVDLGTRIHRNRPLDELSPQALAVLTTALRRAGLVQTPGEVVLRRPAGPGEPDASVSVDVGERPPLVHVPAYRRRSA